MEYDPSKAIALTKEFLLLSKKYKKSPSKALLKKLREINDRYSIANGGGSLFDYHQMSLLKEPDVK